MGIKTKPKTIGSINQPGDTRAEDKKRRVVEIVETTARTPVAGVKASKPGKKAIARLIRTEKEDDEAWDAQFKESGWALELLGDEALKEFESGNTKPLDF
jgi:hypothetical protein